MGSHDKGEAIVLCEKKLVHLGSRCRYRNTFDNTSASAILCFPSLDCVGGRLFNSKEGGRRCALNSASGGSEWLQPDGQT